MKIRPEPSHTHGSGDKPIKDSSLPKPDFKDLEETTDIRVPESERKDMHRRLAKINPERKIQEELGIAILKDLENHLKNRLKGG